MRRFLLAGLLLVVATLAQGGSVSRIGKTCGTTNFSTEVTAGCTTIKAAEVDTDINTLYTAIDNLDNSNLSASANILGSKLASGTVTATQLQAGTITTAQVSPTAALTGSQLAAQTITPTQLAVNASVNAFTTGILQSNLAAFSTVETSILTGPISITTRGGAVEFIASAVVTASSQGTATGTFRWYRDGSLLQSISFQAAPATINVPFSFPITVPSTRDIPSAGAHTYDLRMIASGTALTFFTVGSPGVIFAVERS